MNAIQLSLLLKDKTITQIYTGLERGCRCGCHGTYWKPGDKGFTRAFNKAKDLDPIVNVYAFDESACNKALEEHCQNDCDGLVRAVAQRGPRPESESWIDISRGNGKTITIYFK